MLALAAAAAVLAAIAAGVVVMAPVNLPVIGLLFGSRADFGDGGAFARRLTVADGYRIGIYATGLGDARVMQAADDGSILVSVPGEGVVRHVAADGNGDGRADGISTLVSGLDRPHGLLLEGRALVVAEIGKLIRITFDAGWTETGRETLLAGMPTDGGHSTRTVGRGPDGALYVTVGSSCNVCAETHPWRAAMLRIDPETAEPEIFATGLRNTVGFDWQPGTGNLYGVDNGRDWLGDDFPPDELNLIAEHGFYGWPHFNGMNVPDPDMGEGGGRPPLAPVHAFAAHIAPLSVRFLEHQADPAMARTALVAQHGSWNRSTKIGYRVVALHWAEDGTITQEPFITGFEKDGDVIGRPVDTIETADGTIYVSDDFAGVIYRVTPVSQ